MKGVDRRNFLKGSALGALALAAPARRAFALCPPPPPVAAVVAGKERDRLRILAVTDLHFFWRDQSHDRRTIDHLKRMRDRFTPDLIVVDGDFWHENPEGKGLSYCEFACARMGELGIPWALARGNHDQVNDNDERSALRLLTDAPHSLFRGADSDGNYRVEARNPGGERPFWNLFLVNDAYPGARGFGPAQMDWLRADAEQARNLYGPVPAFVFTHIPIVAFDDLVQSGQARGIRLEKVSFEQGSPDALAALKQTGDVQAIFCGHDHVNNFHGVRDGIYLEYLRSTGQGGYGGMQVPKGGTLIVADGARAAFKSATVFPDGRQVTYKWRVMPQLRPRRPPAHAVVTSIPG